MSNWNFSSFVSYIPNGYDDEVTSSPTIAEDTLPVRRAIKHYDAHRGPQRSNSNAYKLALTEIRSSKNPMATAEKLLRHLEEDRSRADRKAITDLCEGHEGWVPPPDHPYDFDPIELPREVTATDIARLESYLRGRYPGARLDHGHVALLSKMEARVFDGTLTREEFVRLGLAALLIAIFVPSQNAWVEASK